MLVSVFTQGILGMLYMTLAVLLFFIGYRLYQKYAKKGRKSNAIYFNPDPLKNRLIIGKFESYVELGEPMKIKVYLADLNGVEKHVILEKEFGVGLNTISFDSSQFEDGEYFYTIISEDMKSEKKIKLQNH